MKHACSAYFDKSTGESTQTITEHIYEGINYLDEFYIGRRFDEYLVRLAGYLDLAIQREEARKALYASYIFHDLGKLHHKYQEAKSSFGGHEVISAYWVYSHGKELGLEKLLPSVIYAVYLHHHDLRKEMPERIKNVNLCSECIDFLIRKYEEKTNVGLIGYETKFEENIHEKLIKIFNQIMNSDKGYRYIRLSYPLLQATHAADNFSASKRGGKQTPLSIEIQKVSNSIRALRESFKPIY